MNKTVNFLVTVVVVVAAFAMLVDRAWPPSTPAPAQVIAEPRVIAEPQALFPAGPLLAEKVTYRLAIFHLPKPKVAPAETMRRLVADRSSAIELVTGQQEPKGLPNLWVEALTTSEYPLPEASHLEYFGRGLSDADLASLAAGETVTLLEVSTTGAKAASTLHEVQQLAAALAKETGGLLWDEETRLLFSQDAWAKLLEEGWKDGAPHVPSHTVLHLYRTETKLMRVISLGMLKFGLPELVVNDAAPSAGQSMGSLVNLVSQRLYEAPSLETAGALDVDIDALVNERLRASLTERLLEGASRRARISLGKGKLEKGDAENRLVEILFPTEPGRGLAEAQQALLHDLFGSEDAIVDVDHGNDALMQASARARRTAIESIKPRLGEILASAGRLAVKAPFKTDTGGHEYMWIEVTEWDGATVRGILDNEPFEIAGLKAGARVSVAEASIFDYVLRRGDGTTEGNETGKIIERMTAGQ